MNYQKTCSEKYKVAYNELKKQRDMGLLFISGRAIAALERLEKVDKECRQAWEDDSCGWIEIYETELEAIEACLTEMRLIAIEEINHY